MTPPDLDQTIRAIDHASAMSDRWMFIAVLVILMGFAGACIYWLVGQNETQRKAHAEMIKDLIIALHDATAVMKDVRELLEKTEFTSTTTKT